MNRSAGILLPLSSLPSKYGIGCFSKSAYEFVDWLKEAGQSYWQDPSAGTNQHTEILRISLSQRLREIPTLSVWKH